MDKSEQHSGMSQKRIRSTLYMEDKLKWVNHELTVECDPDGYLYADGRYRTKILPGDLPEWYVYGYLHKRHGYISAKDVKYLIYKPNYSFDNHLHKDDFLYISYDREITWREEDYSRYVLYEGYQNLVYGHLIIEFLDAAEKYSRYDVSEIRQEIERKRTWYKERNGAKGEAAHEL